MSADLGTLSLTAFVVGLIHCACGPDHYVPFVAMSRVGLWSLRKTLLITALCGIGHVAGSALLGFIGIAFGLILFQLESAEQIRGNAAGWMLAAFGAIYFVWGVVLALRNRRPKPGATEQDVMEQVQKEADEMAPRAGSLTPWILFAVFLFGPCEPLIPLLMYPAAQANVWSVICVTAVFGITTLVTMLTLVAVIYRGSDAFRFQWAQVYGHAVAGGMVLACGVAIVLGL